METRYIGSMVSIDCGEVLGIYQGILSGIDQSKQMLNIVDAFHNGVRCSVPLIAINAADISDLKIIKDVTEAKSLVSATGQQYSKKTETVRNAPQNDRRISPQAQDGSIVSFQQSRPDVAPTVKSNKESSKQPNIGHVVKQASAASPRKASVKSTPRGLNGKKSQNVTDAESRSSPHKKQVNGLMHNKQLSSGMMRAGGYSPSDLRTVPASDEMIKSADCFQEINSRYLPRKRTTSDVSSMPRNGWKSPGGRHGVRGVEEDCFAVPIDSIVNDEFDFEKNLALFDKRAVFDKIERQRELAGSTTPTSSAVVGSSSPRPNDAKYRCDENILPGRSAVYRQILVSNATSVVAACEYVTDSGLVVPSVQPTIRNELLAAARRTGFDRGRQMEMVGRSAAEMVLQLLGGGNRFDPKNMHQCPQVAVLCGSGSQAAYAVNCARHLASRRIQLTVFLPDSASLSDGVEVEKKLLDMNGARLTTSDYKSLPTSPVDVIVSALDGDGVDLSREVWYQPVVNWASDNKAPVLCLDPPCGNVSIAAKWSLAVALPLAYSDRCGQIYLCDLGLPARLYRDAGLKTYKSPFAHKFVIPLHLP